MNAGCLVLPLPPNCWKRSLCSNDHLHFQFPTWKIWKSSATSWHHSEAGWTHGITVYYVKGRGFPGGTDGKESVCQCKRCSGHGLSPCIGKILWRRKWQPTPVYLPGGFHGQRSLVGYSPWGRIESNTAECARSEHMKEKCKYY